MQSFAEQVFNATPNEGPWDSYKFSPKSRTIYPTAVFSTEGLVQDADSLIGNNDNIAYLKGEGSAISLDFGINACGIYAIEFGADTTEGQSVHIAFSECNMFVNKDNSDRTMDFLIDDKTLEVPAAEGVYVCPFAKQRGGFKYMTISTRKSGKVAIKKVYTTMNCMPSLGDNLRDYSGYFYSNDEFANTIWYAGAYTLQLSIIPVNSGRSTNMVVSATGWDNDVPCGYGEEVLVDGARRDRTVWSGDRAISQLSEFVTFNSDAGKLSTDWILDHQKPNGQFPYATEPIYVYFSDTYHLWTMKSIYNTFMLNSNSLDWLKKAWPQYKKGIEYGLGLVDDTGLIKIQCPMDWGRDPLSGHQMSVNCILYITLKDGAEVAKLVGDPETEHDYLKKASELKKLINSFFWDDKYGAFFDSDDNKIFPQDGNVLALLLGVADEDKIESISKNLTKNWNEFGACAPEMKHSVSPFISSFELLAHTQNGFPERSFELFRTMWGYIWNAPYAVKSSLVEGYFGTGELKYAFTGYDPAYISHCHPWSTGPTYWLSAQIAGLNVIGNEHKNWELKPEGVFCKGSLEYCQTGFTSRTTGFFTAGWKKHTDKLLQLVVRAPEGTHGVVGIPIRNDAEISKVEVDGEEINLDKLAKSVRHLLIQDIAAGNHEVIVTYD